MQLLLIDLTHVEGAGKGPHGPEIRGLRRRKTSGNGECPHLNRALTVMESEVDSKPS